MVDKNYRISVINKSAKLFLGLGQSICTGKYLEEVLNGFIFSRPLDKLKISNQETESFELRKEGPLPVYLSVTVSRIKDDKGLTVNTIFVIRDVTDRKKEEAVKKNFLRLMSHKLRTPLTSIIGFVEILEEKESFDRLDETGRKSVAVIEKESKHLSGLVDKLLRFTLLEAESLNLTLEKISLKELVSRALDSLGGLIKEKDVEVSLEGLSEPGSFEGDREKLQETLENLIENAVKFNEGKEKKVFIKGGVTKDGNIALSVIDNGPGIPPEKHEFIFEKFQQLEHFFTGQVEGMGLGLALVKRIVRAHRGKVEVKNSEGGGSEFKIILPKTQK